ncbi:hypothetical protein DL96DRAFT_1599357 [Flagelloscypha sp. PMI_526]|nr:hypothetical protein DL96DRAFT_1599357 [Flagelloscypha sp. PMI_526]
MRRKKTTQLEAATYLPNPTAFTSPSTALNAAKPICRIPLEILADIFILCKDEFRDLPFQPYTFDDAPSSVDEVVPAIALSYVCTHFRTVAISTPPFWSMLPLNHIAWTEELLRRSKRAKLYLCRRNSISSNKDKVAFMRCFALALEESYRIEVIDIGGLFSTAHSINWQNCPAYFSKALKEGVKHVSILRQVKAPGCDDNFFVAWFWEFFDRLLDGSKLTLKELDIPVFKALPWKTLRSPVNILNLRITNVSVDMTLQIINLLPCFSSLERLTVLGSIRQRFPGTTVPRFSANDDVLVDMPSLRKINIRLEAHCASKILSCLAAPKLGTLSVDPESLPRSWTPHNPYNLDDPLEHIFENIDRLMNFQTSPTFPAVHLEVAARIQFALFREQTGAQWAPNTAKFLIPPSFDDSWDFVHENVLTGPPITRPGPQTPRNASIRIEYPVYAYSRDPLGSFQRCLEHLSLALSHTTVASVRSFDMPRDHTFLGECLRMLGSLPNIQTLHLFVGQASQSQVMKALAPLSKDRVPFPVLKHLFIQGMRFAPSNPSTQEPDTWEESRIGHHGVSHPPLPPTIILNLGSSSYGFNDQRSKPHFFLKISELKY